MLPRATLVRWDRYYKAMEYSVKSCELNSKIHPVVRVGTTCEMASESVHQVDLDSMLISMPPSSGTARYAVLDRTRVPVLVLKYPYIL